jgi:tetratricopeptide (TPR) repeat protein
MTTVHSTLDELDEALVTGIRALEIAGRLEDLRLRIVAASHLQQAYYYRGDYGHTVESASDNLAALPADWVHENLGMAPLPSVFGRAHLIMSLAELGRFTEADQYKAEAIRLTELSQHPFTIGWVHFAASVLHLLKGDWAKAVSRAEDWIAVLRTGNIAMHHLPWAVTASAWALAQIGEASEALNRLREGVRLLEHQAASGIIAHRSWAYGAASRACLLLGRVDEARPLADRAVESSRRQPGFTAHALRLLGDIATHGDRFDPESGAFHYRQALALARLHGMRPLVAHCYLGLGRLYHRVGETEHARENLTAANTMYREMEMGFYLGQGQGEADTVKSGGTEPGVRSGSKSSTPGGI